MPTKRKPQQVKTVVRADNNWFKNQITAGNLLSVFTIAFGFAGFYFNTASAIESQNKSIIEINRKIAENNIRDDKKETAAVSDRDSLRRDVTVRAERTAEGIAELNKQTAVLSTQLLAIRDDLVKISAQVANVAATTRR